MYCTVQYSIVLTAKFKDCIMSLLTFQIDSFSSIPKYQQLVVSIQDSIREGILKEGDALPSINQIVQRYPVSKDTVIKAYKMMQGKGMITSVAGKGFFVSTTNVSYKHRIFLLFDNFHSYKEALFNSFKEHMGDETVIDLYFHHCNEHLFKTLIKSALNHYTEYVIMPLPDKENFKWIQSVSNGHQFYILDIGYIYHGKHFPSVCQNFKSQWYNALLSVKDRLLKYDCLVLVWWREPRYQFDAVNDREMQKGFEQFCVENDIRYHILREKAEFNIKKRCCYIISNNQDLVDMVLKASHENLEIGRDVGIISHNDEPLKKIATRTGIATISTDFVGMGERMAAMIRNKETKHIENQSSMIIRDSI